MAWIPTSFDPNIVFNSCLYKTTTTMRTHLKKDYNQNDAAQWFQLEHDIATSKQDSLFIYDFYSQFMNLWTEYTDISYLNLTSSLWQWGWVHIKSLYLNCLALQPHYKRGVGQKNNHLIDVVCTLFQEFHVQSQF